MAVVNQDKPGFDLFRTVFHDNLRKRSRTAKGKTDTTVSDKKKKLELDGVDLEIQVRINTEVLINSVWNSAGLKNINPSAIRQLMEEWNAINNKGLQRPDAYLEERKKLEEQAAELVLKTGRPCRINKAYRVWNWSHGYKIPPLGLESAMDMFYESLALMIRSLTEQTAEAPFLAYADLMSDSGIHPWADGCSRTSTALVMWLSIIIPGFTLPYFGSREEHYRAIEDLNEHIEYYRKCLNRSIA